MAEMIIADGENNAVENSTQDSQRLLRRGYEESAVRTSNSTSKVRDEAWLANSLEDIIDTACHEYGQPEHRKRVMSPTISLMNYMGIPPEKRIGVKGELNAPEVEGNRPLSLERAQTNRADLKKLKEQLEYQENQIQIEKSGGRPKITFGISAGYLDPYQKTDVGDDTWRAALSVTVPIFDRNTSRGNAIKAGAVLEQDKIALEQKELDIKSEVEIAWSEAESTLQHLKASEKALDLAKESLRLAEVGFREGVTPQLDLLSAQTSLTAARLEYAKSQFNHLIAIVALKVTEGTVIPWTWERRLP